MQSLKATVGHFIAMCVAVSGFGICLTLLSCHDGLCSAGVDDGPDQPEDRKLAEANNWIYNDLSKGFAEAERTGRPLFVVIRCPP